MHTYIHTHKQHTGQTNDDSSVYIYKYTHTCTYIHKNKHIHTRDTWQIHDCWKGASKVAVCIYIYIHIYICIRRYRCIYICAYTYT